MPSTMRLSKLSQCILLATSSLIMTANVSAAVSVKIVPDQHSQKNEDFTLSNNGVNKKVHWDLDKINQKAAAVLKRDAENHNVYFSGPPRNDKDSQSVICAVVRTGEKQAI